jgi:FkbM family methyltransferase
MNAIRKFYSAMNPSLALPKIWRRKEVTVGALSQQLAKVRNSIRDTDLKSDSEFLWFCSEHLEKSHSQVFQDLFVQFILGSPTNGYFCEFGATDGIELSNSYTLETYFGWSGVCAEPARSWQEAFRKNRPSTAIETDCVWAVTGETIVFNEVAGLGLSTIADFSDSDRHAKRRRGSRSSEYNVRTISLNDLLAKYEAPAEFEYLSVDTEGSEFEILSNLDFNRYRPRVITVEHNYTSRRADIFQHLTGHGYRRVFEQFSDFDDWYLSESVSADIV